MSTYDEYLKHQILLILKMKETDEQKTRRILALMYDSAECLFNIDEE